MSKTADRRVKGLIFLSPSDNVGLVKDPEGAADHAICWPEAQALRESGRGPQLLSHLLWGDKVLSADAYINLFSDDSHVNVFHFYDPGLPWDVVRTNGVPVIAFTGARDDGIAPVIDPDEAMQLLEKNLVHSPRVQTIVLEDAERSFHGFEPAIVEATCAFIKQ